MAARNPTSFVDWKHYVEARATKAVVATTADNLINNQIFLLDQQDISLLVAFSYNVSIGVRRSTTSASFVKFGDFKIRCKDMCDVDTTTNDETPHVFAVKAARSAAGTATGEFKFTSANATTSTSGTLSQALTTTPTWYGYTSLNCASNDVEDTISIEFRRTAGTGSILLYAAALYASET